MKLILTAILTLLVSCQHHENSSDKKAPENTELIPHIETFIMLTGVYNLPATMFSHHLKPGIMGVCTLAHRTRLVQINGDRWNSLSPVQQEMLVLHELVHCSCPDNRHDDTPLDSVCPMSMMHPHSMPSGCAITHREMYFREIIRRCVR
jgi:hypothetical protein